jgi:hypothetical protein
MDSKTIIKKLQTFDSFKNLSEYQIRKNIGNDYGIKRATNVELQIELDELLKPGKIYIKGKGYTEDELSNIIDYYNQHKSNIKSNILNDDILGEILFSATPDTIKAMCLTNTSLYKKCQNDSFWLKKFSHDNLPEPFKLPKTIDAWIKSYEKMSEKHDFSEKLVNKIIKTGIFTGFSVFENVKKMKWLPEEILKNVKKGDYHISYNISHGKYYIKLILNDKEVIVSVEVSKNEFINQLTLLLYHLSKFILWDDEDADNYLSFKNSKIKELLNLFPDW